MSSPARSRASELRPSGDAAAARRRGPLQLRAAAAFTLVELLIVVAIIAALLAMLLPGLRQARGQARAVACASNLHQLAVANSAYAAENNGRYCPGAAGMRTDNLRRWHGTRGDNAEPFDPQRGPLVPYLGADARIRACPSFQQFTRAGAPAFERGCGGHGYNQAYVGRVLQKRRNGSFQVVTDQHGVMSESVRRPSETLMFADAAFAGAAEGVVEYSFAEPRFHPEYLHVQARMDPSIHFRHGGRTNVAWCDGRVSRERQTFTWTSGLYEGDPSRHALGWFGQSDDNGYFDLE